MHVVPEDPLIADVKKIKQAKTVGGATVDVTYHFLAGVNVGTAKEMAHMQTSGIHASNGVIHVIDKVIVLGGNHGDSFCSSWLAWWLALSRA